MNNVLLSVTALADTIANLFRGMGNIMREWMLAVPMSIAKGVFIVYFIFLIVWVVRLPENEVSLTLESGKMIKLRPYALFSLAVTIIIYLVF
ncbi:MAG TPA: hypothetical protein QGF08_01645 [Candidatus Marinimicrobia bacterium]|jgi:hypothetical protein|nr:hypothetical protein [Candidatus Neomarinimicrobiota bacterium]HJL74769.1 hypothetical protein [Candidatus Neomarinimicrobiota bacterium]HJM69567.1 hypothetical protein [Candidatus Neomarinimicrobiota bacterium]|tara:strand:- start:6883 stop:7158 length:276 start_codon:yes stop_codon:yes gene_type:complete